MTELPRRSPRTWSPPQKSCARRPIRTPDLRGPPEKGRDILLSLQSDQSVPRPEVDEEWVDVDAA